MAIPRKPLKNIDEFIKMAKDEGKSEFSETSQTKKFLIELPYDVWKKLKMKAIEEGKPLKEIILEILKNAVT